jgi:hypothetical protein
MPLDTPPKLFVDKKGVASEFQTATPGRLHRFAQATEERRDGIKLTRIFLALAAAVAAAFVVWWI